MKLIILTFVNLLRILLIPTLRKSHLPVLAVLIIVFISLPVFSQEAIRLNDAIKIALDNSPSVSNLRKTLDIQDLAVSSAWGRLYPDLNLNARWSRNNTFSEGTVRFENGVPIIIPKQDTWINNFNVGLSTQVTLFDGLNNYSRIDLEKENLKAAKIDLEKEVYDISYRVNTAYFDVLKKERIVQANEANLEDSKSQLEKINEFLNVGKRTIADVYRQDVQVAQNELALERSKNELAKSKVELLRTMNENVDKEFKAEDLSIKGDLTDAEIEMMMRKYSDTDLLYRQAVEKRYDYKSGIQDINISKQIYGIDNASVWWPSVSGFASYNLSASRLGALKDTRNFSFGLSLSYPIFQGFSVKNRAQTSQINIMQKEEILKTIEVQIKSEIKKAYLDLETQNKQIEILKRNIRSAEQDKILSEENYRLGMGILLDVQTATTKLNLLNIDLINAYYDFLLAERQLQYYSGMLSY